MPRAVAEAVHARAGGVCEVLIPWAGCTGSAEHIHHRQLRSQGGAHDLDNCLAICHRCHSFIHAYPARSYECGWLVRSVDSPADVVVVVAPRD